MSNNLQPLELNSTKETPDVIGDLMKGELIVSGNIIKTNALEVFAPINKWIDSYLESENRALKVIFDIEILSTSASLFITDLILRLNSLHKKGKNIEFYWHYPAYDEFLCEDGEDFQQLAKFRFNLVEK